MTITLSDITKLAFLIGLVSIIEGVVLPFTHALWIGELEIISYIINAFYIKIALNIIFMVVGGYTIYFNKGNQTYAWLSILANSIALPISIQSCNFARGI